MNKAVIYVHGMGGSYKEAEQYRQNCLGFDIYGVDYGTYFPWSAENKIKAVYSELSLKYNVIYLLANSIGAYFSMYALQNCNIERALFISPILDMEKLILDMMSRANISEEELLAKGEIETDFGETLSWKYLCFVRKNPIIWNTHTKILYSYKDNLTSYQTVKKFIDSHDADVTIMKNGEHWFHTEEQLEFLNNWMKKAML